MPKRWPALEIIRKFLRPQLSGKQGVNALTVGEWVVYVHELPAARLDEAPKRGPLKLGGAYSARLDVPRVPNVKHHFHVFNRSGPMFAVNMDGTSHDGSRGVRIPNDVATALKSKYPQFQVPPDNIIEWIGQDDQSLLFG